MHQPRKISSNSKYITRYRTKDELYELRSQVTQQQQHNLMKSNNSLVLLNTIEETLLLGYYQKEVIEYFINNSTKGTLPISVYSGACYFSRIFYLKSSIYKYDPLFICYLCFYIAAKVEHHYMSISSYLKMLPDCYRSYREEFVLKEVEVLKNMNFDLNHASIFDSIDGLLMQYDFYMINKASVDEKNNSPYFSTTDNDNQAPLLPLLPSNNNNNNNPNEGVNSKDLYIDKLRCKARNKALFLLTTDLILIHPPSQLAAAILVDDIGYDILIQMLRCFMENREDVDFVEKHTKRYSTKMHNAKEAIALTESSYSINWKELVVRYNKIVNDISKN